METEGPEIQVQRWVDGSKASLSYMRSCVKNLKEKYEKERHKWKEREFLEACDQQSQRPQR